MTRIGYHASHEQFSPCDLRDYVVQAEQAGFDGVMSSEHIAPWSVRQGHSGFAWSWLGAALQATQTIPMGSLAIPGGWRYHPVVVAHAFATLSHMFPGRFRWIAAGSGEIMNEHVVGADWPDKTERNARLRAGVDIIRALWRGETVTRETGYHRVDQAKIWDLPSTPPRIYGAALSDETAAWLGEWADGMITVRAPVDDLKKRIGAFRSHGGEGKPLVLQLQISWDRDLDQARRNAHDQWRHVAAQIDSTTLKTPEEIDRACDDVALTDMDKAICLVSDAKTLLEQIKTYADLGFDEIYIHNAGCNQPDFIAFFQAEIKPHLPRRA